MRYRRDAEFDPFVKWLRPYRVQYTICGLAQSVGAAVLLFGGVVLGWLVDAVVSGRQQNIGVLVALYVAIGIIASGMDVVVRRQVAKSTWRLTNDIRDDLTRGLLYSVSERTRDYSSGAVLGRLDDDVTRFTAVVSSFVTRVVSMALIGVGATVALLIVAPQLAFVYAPCILLSFALFFRTARKAIPSAEMKRAAASELTAFEEQVLSASIDLASLGHERSIIARFASTASRLVERTVESTRLTMRAIGVVGVALTVSEALMVLWGLALLNSGAISVGVIFTGWRLASLLREPTSQILWQLPEISDAVGSMQRIRGAFTDLLPATPRDGAVPDDASITFRDLSFSYIEIGSSGIEDFSSRGLRGISFSLPEGSSLGLLGRTGSGKTTLARLVLAQLTAEKGSVRIGDLDIGDVDPKWIDVNIAAALQDVHFFPGSLRDNLTLFSRCTDAEISESLRKFGLHHLYVHLDSDLNLLDISEGEAQLLSLVRTVMSNPRIVVMDEPTARVDPRTHEQAMHSISEYLTGRTAIVIAHRLSTLDSCDYIGVLNSGELVEFGLRADLIKDQESQYAKMLKRDSTSRITEI
jgi:ATP-binding cassette, subfamily B, bacterial